MSHFPDAVRGGAPSPQDQSSSNSSLASTCSYDSDASLESLLDSPLEDLSWVNKLDDAVNRATHNLSLEDSWRQTLEWTIEAWINGRIDKVKANCEAAFEVEGEMDLFIELSFAVLYYRVIEGAYTPLIRLLHRYQELLEGNSKFTDHDRAAVAFLRAVVVRPTPIMKDEFTACLGMPRSRDSPFLQRPKQDPRKILPRFS